MERWIQFAIVGLFASACTATTVTPVVTGGHRAKGTVTLTYFHRSRHLVDWSAAESDAIRRCRAWGYESADLFPGTTQTCVQSNSYGCTQYQSEVEAQCLVERIGPAQGTY